MAAAGPLARNVDDLEAALASLWGPGLLDDGAADWPPFQPAPHRRDPSTLRVAFCWDIPGWDVDTEIADASQRFADSVARLGVTVSDRAFPAISAVDSHALYLALADAAVNPFSELTHQAWRDLDNARAALRHRWRAFFRDWDALITPVSPVTAPAHDTAPFHERLIHVNGREIPAMELLCWPALASAAYLPATAFPVGLSTEGLPLGLQAIGPAGGDSGLLEIVRAMTSGCPVWMPPHLDV